VRPRSPDAAQDSIRLYDERDTEAVLELIGCDRVPGQPRVDEEALAAALAGRSRIDSGWWEELDAPRTTVSTRDGVVTGVISYSRRAHDRTGVILWMHAREDSAVLRGLIAEALDRMRAWGCTRHEAFAFASALALGQEGLPVGHRAATAAALKEAGFVGADLWRYMRLEIGPRRPSTVPGGARLTLQPATEHEGWTLQLIGDDDDPSAPWAQADIGRPTAGIGVLWWITTDPRLRGRGLGRAILQLALDALGERGVHEVILYVDDDEPGGSRDRRAANRLYDSAGFVEIDRLHSYRTETEPGGDRVLERRRPIATMTQADPAAHRRMLQKAERIRAGERLGTHSGDDLREILAARQDQGRSPKS